MCRARARTLVVVALVLVLVGLAKATPLSPVSPVSPKAALDQADSVWCCTYVSLIEQYATTYTTAADCSTSGGTVVSGPDACFGPPPLGGETLCSTCLYSNQTNRFETARLNNIVVSGNYNGLIGTKSTSSGTIELYPYIDVSGTTSTSTFATNCSRGAYTNKMMQGFCSPVMPTTWSEIKVRCQ